MIIPQLLARLSQGAPKGVSVSLITPVVNHLRCVDKMLTFPVTLQSFWRTPVQSRSRCLKTCTVIPCWPLDATNCVSRTSSGRTHSCPVMTCTHPAVPELSKMLSVLRTSYLLRLSYSHAGMDIMFSILAKDRAQWSERDGMYTYLYMKQTNKTQWAWRKCIKLARNLNPFPADVANKRHIGSAPKSHCVTWQGKLKWLACLT
jgi:hypothetical protein